MIFAAAATGHRRSSDEEGVTDEFQFLFDRFENVIAGPALDRIPFVHDDDRRATASLGISGDFLILRGQPFRRVYDDQGDYRSIESSKRPDETVVFDILAHLRRLRTKTSGVDKAKLAPLELEEGVDGVSSRSRNIAHDRRASPTSRLRIEDLPALGRPTIAIFISSSSVASADRG